MIRKRVHYYRLPPLLLGFGLAIFFAGKSSQSENLELFGYIVTMAGGIPCALFFLFGFVWMFTFGRKSFSKRTKTGAASSPANTAIK